MVKYQTDMYPDISIWLSIAFVIGGLAALAWSANMFVDGASALAKAFGVSRFIIGMVIIGFGTSAPELCVSALSGATGHSDLSLGNAYGSCVFNIAVILGVAALIRPLLVKPSVVFAAVPALIGIALLSCLLVAAGGGFSRIDGIVLLAVFGVLMPLYCWFDQSQVRGKEAKDEVDATPAMPLWKAWLLLLVGLALLVGSSHVLVWGCVDLARVMGVSELLIGLTVVALGTSLPELASAIASARKGEHEFVLGNIVGSNFFNTLAVVGLAGAISPFKNVSPYILTRDLPVMLFATLLIAVFGLNFRKPREAKTIGRLSGAAWLVLFAVYLGLMLVQETRGDVCFMPRLGTECAPDDGIVCKFMTQENPRRCVLDFSGSKLHTGTLRGMSPDKFHSLRWISPAAGALPPEQITYVSDDLGNLELPPKPDAGAWRLVVTELDSLTLQPGADVRLDYGGAGVGGYPVFRVTENDPSATLRISYSCHPDGLGPKGDFWRETSARYLGRDVDLPILPANIDRYESYALASNAVYRAPLLQGLVRYVRLRLDGAAKPVTLASFAFANDRVHSAGERAGTFDCSDRQLAAIWEASVRTVELSSIPSYDSVWGPKPVRTLPYIADGAKRDRLVWSGDLWWAERSFFVGFNPKAPYMKGSVEMLAVNHTPEGYVQASPWPDQAVPKSREWGPFGSDEFAAWLVPVAWDTYFYTGDIDLLRKVYPVVQGLMAYLARYQNPDTGIFEQRKETCKHAAGLVFGGTSLHHRSYMNILLWKTYVDAAQMARTLGAQADADRWTAAADKLAVSIRKVFWDGGKGRFRLSAEEGKMGLEANALALAARFATRDEAARIMPQLRRIGHGKFQAMAARGKFEYGDADAAIAVIDAHNWRKILDPSWKGMRLTSECMGLVRKGWGDEAHPDTAIAGLFTNYLLGIEPTSPGFDTFSFRVPKTSRITWASGTVPTPHGDIVASWERLKSGQVMVYVKVPDGASCRLEVPGSEPVTLGPGEFSKMFK